ncbi:NUDIX domain-containing protein [Actinokineospora bangkokensis]|uniref:ADP-ribose pyrophosphatase n=1 Tax=Actinokineospora bangkokensis TaxID=1193682 RepID=A0A1Q9LH60_9PSEU|nr:NUDIX hydrolase [Actinokineospora bangkokensis]OLR91381.1 ADP-ribose pyrophosphatase [Actinokineospora bangkokensis]
MERLDTKQVYANAWMTVREDAIRRPDGSPGIYGVVDKPHCALVIPIEGERLLLVEQFRYPLGRRCWEFVQGTAPDLAVVEPTELARAELREETGLTAERVDKIGELAIAPGMSSQTCSVFVATGLTQGEPDREVTELDMRTGWFTRREFEDLVRNGTITDSPSLAAYAQFLLGVPR